MNLTDQNVIGSFYKPGKTLPNARWEWTFIHMDYASSMGIFPSEARSAEK